MQAIGNDALLWLVHIQIWRKKKQQMCFINKIKKKKFQRKRNVYLLFEMPCESCPIEMHTALD